MEIVFLNGPTPASFSFIFGLFQANINTIFTTNQCEKNIQMSIQYTYSVGIQTYDLSNMSRHP